MSNNKPDFPDLSMYAESIDTETGEMTFPTSPKEQLTIGELRNKVLSAEKLKSIVPHWEIWQTTLVDKYIKRCFEIKIENDEIETHNAKTGEYIDSEQPELGVYTEKAYINYPEPVTPISFDESQLAVEWRNALVSRINQRAGEKRESLVSAGFAVVEEYRIAADHTKTWLDAGSPEESVPRVVSEWADAEEMPYAIAAATIMATASAWENVILDVRKLRLEATAYIRKKDTDGNYIHSNQEVQNYMFTVMNEISKIQPPA